MVGRDGKEEERPGGLAGPGDSHCRGREAKAMTAVSSRELRKVHDATGLWGLTSRNSPPLPYLGSRVGHAVCNISDKAPDISILYQAGNSFRDIVQKPHGIAKKIH